MASDSAPMCIRCGGATTYRARVSLPARFIYRCKSCGHDTWVSPQPNVQQQQQIQPKPTDRD